MDLRLSSLVSTRREILAAGAAATAAGLWATNGIAATLPSSSQT